MASFLWQIGWREIDRHLLIRHGEPNCRQRRANALAAFRYGLICKTDNAERILGAAVTGDVDLDVDLARFDAVKRDCIDVRNHRSPRMEGIRPLSLSAGNAR